MKDKKLPSFQFYPGDWRKDIGVQSLSFHDRGVWLEMLVLMHDSERRGVLVLNGTAMSDEMISRAIGLDNQIFQTTLTNLLSSGVASREDGTGAIFNRRMVRDENIRKMRTECGKMGGNPVLLNQSDNQTSTPSARKMKLKTEDLVEKENYRDIDHHMIATEVRNQCRISSDRVHVQIAAQAEMELDSGRNADDVLANMVASWNAFQEAKPKLSITPGAEKFFGEGMWRDQKTWPWISNTRQNGREARRQAFLEANGHD